MGHGREDFHFQFVITLLWPGSFFPFAYLGKGQKVASKYAWEEGPQHCDACQSTGASNLSACGGVRKQNALMYGLWRGGISRGAILDQNTGKRCFGLNLSMKKWCFFSASTLYPDRIHHRARHPAARSNALQGDVAQWQSGIFA